jgi:hypothetical protein
MKKILLFTIIAFSISIKGFAQHDGGLKITAGPELGFATGDFSNNYSLSYGATGQLEIKLQENLKGTFTSGIIFYNGKSLGNGVKNTGLNVIPLRVGGKYFFTAGIYGALQLGVGFLNKDLGTAFAYSPQIGYEFVSNNGKGLELTFKYDGYSKSGTIGGFAVRLAFVLL